MFEPYVEKLNRHVDDRGSVYCILDKIGTHIAHTNSQSRITTYENRLQIKRIYTVHNWKAGRIRAWHGHATGWTGMHVLSGAAKLAAFRIDKAARLPDRVAGPFVSVLSPLNPGIFWVPPGFFNGAMSLEPNTTILCMSTLDFSQVKQDDVRAPILPQDRELFKVEDR